MLDTLDPIGTYVFSMLDTTGQVAYIVVGDMGETVIETKLLYWIRARGATQAGLAMAAGVSRTTVYHLAHDHWEQVSRDVLERVCTSLAITPGDLLAWRCDDGQGEGAAGAGPGVPCEG